MKFHSSLFLSLLIVGLPGITSGADAQPSQQIEYPAGWQKWSSIAVSHRTDNKTMRIILGNDIAVTAGRSGKTNPWPEGAILGKVVWEAIQLEDWPEATVPGKFVHVEFMVKDTKKYSETYGWGWGRWVGPEQKPFEKGTQPCISCHTPVKDRDWVFTDPAHFPDNK